MTDEKLKDTYQQLGRLSAQSLDEGRHDDAFKYAVSAYYLVPDTDQYWKTNFLILIEKICKEALAHRRGNSFPIN